MRVAMWRILAPRQHGRQASVHKRGTTHASRGAMYSHGTEQERKEGTEPDTGRNKTDAQKPLEGGPAPIYFVDGMIRLGDMATALVSVSVV